MTEWCVDDRHGTPCPQPPNGDRCDACNADGCDSTQVVEADTPQDAARTAGWSEAYIADQDWSPFL